MAYERVRRTLTFQVANLDSAIEYKLKEQDTLHFDLAAANSKLFQLREERQEVLGALSALGGPIALPVEDSDGDDTGKGAE